MHAHACTHAYVHVHPRTCISCIRPYTHTHAHIHMCHTSMNNFLMHLPITSTLFTSPCTYAHAYTCMHMCTCTCIHAYMHTSIHTHTCTHTHAYACMHMHTCIRLGKRTMLDGNPLASALGEDPFIPVYTNITIYISMHHLYL